MFTGIIEGLGAVKGITQKDKGFVFRIAPYFILDDPKQGESIAVNGVCLTATTIAPGFFTADASPETLSRSNLGDLKAGDVVNLERALRFSDRIGGHLVSGHIDGTGSILEKRPLGQFVLISVAVPQNFERYIIEKGSIALDGISLTVNNCGPGRFSVSIIPHTAGITTLDKREAGGKVNIELDIIGKYIEKLLMLKGPAGAAEEGKKLDQSFLARHGFM